MSHSFSNASNSDQPPVADDLNADKIADAVMVLRRSGLFSVEPLDNDNRNQDTPFHFDGFVNEQKQRRRARVFSPVFPTPLLPPSSFGMHRSSTPLPSRSPPLHNVPNVNTMVTSQPTLTADAIFVPTPRVPHISTFSGNPSKTDVSFEAWKFEVKCLLNDKTYNEDLLLQGVRKSLRGEAAKLSMHLGEKASVERIIEKLEGVYGIVETGSTLLQRFYNSKQEPDETIASYSCRIEEIVNRAIDRGVVSRSQVDEMLRTKLWTGLKDDRVRNAIRFKLDQVTNFDRLRAELRSLEQEFKEFDVTAHSKTYRSARATHMPQLKKTSSEDTKPEYVDTLERRIQNLEAKLPDTTELLNKILDKINRLEAKDAEKTKEANNQVNSRGSLPGTNQRAQQSRK